MSRVIFLQFLFILGSLGSPPLQLEPLSDPIQFNNPNKVQQSQIRLPLSLIPSHYDLTIRPIINKPLDDPEQFTAPGRVLITVVCREATNVITMHSDDIDIQEENVKVTNAGSIEEGILSFSNDSSLSTWSIRLSADLVVGVEYIIDIPFTAKVGDRLSGLYRSWYKDDNGNNRYLATTQFQALGARMAFPCFDEPALKATFKIRIQRPKDYSALSNGQSQDVRIIPNEPDWIQEEFFATVRMSTYLVAFVVSDFKFIEAPAGLSKYVVKVWGQPREINDDTVKFSSESSAKIVNFLEEYLDFDYQFEKLDSAAIPQFAYGAMENWALNTYRQNLLIWWGRSESTQYELWRSAMFMGHEISHHWFGDLVTCNWWNDMWLNEGFADYMMFMGATAVDGFDFQIFDRYILDEVHFAMDFDVTGESVPVYSSDTTTVVDLPSAIIYEKGASLVRMMQTFLSDKTLMAGIQNYLKKHQYSTVTHRDIFEALQDQADIDGSLPGTHSLTQIMESWTLSTGFPLIRISNTGVPNRIYVSQEKFMLPSIRNGHNSSTYQGELYYVPVTIATKQNPDFEESNWKPKLWMDKQTLLTSTVIDGSINEWVVVNPDARNYYRVLYDDHFHSLIINQLQEDHSVISRLSRAQMIDDYFKSSFAKYVNIKKALDFSLHLGNELENTVWTTFFNNIRQLNTLLMDQPLYDRFKFYLTQKIESVLDTIGWYEVTNDPQHRIFLRAQLLDWTCSFGSSKCTPLIVEWAQDPDNANVYADYQPAIYCRGMALADSISNTFDVRGFILSKYATVWRDERLTLFINAMACESNLEEVQKLLSTTIDSDSAIDRSRHGIPLLRKLALNPENRIAILDFLTEDLESLKQELGESAISGVIASVASYTTSTNAADYIRATVEKLIAEGNLSSNTVEQLESSLVQLQKNQEFISDLYNDIDTWLPPIP